MKYLAEIQMLSLALQGNWAGVEKIAVIMEVEALRHFVGTCGRLGYQCGDIISVALARAADEEPSRCRVIDAEGEEVLPGIIARTPGVSKPHIGKEGWAERINEGSIRIVLDDGSILMGYECWWEPVKADEELF